MLPKLASHALLAELAACRASFLVARLVGELGPRLAKAAVAYLCKAALCFLPLLLHGLVIEVSLLRSDLAQVARLLRAVRNSELLLLEHRAQVHLLLRLVTSFDNEIVS